MMNLPLTVLGLIAFKETRKLIYLKQLKYEELLKKIEAEEERAQAAEAAALAAKEREEKKDETVPGSENKTSIAPNPSEIPPQMQETTTPPEQPRPQEPSPSGSPPDSPRKTDAMKDIRKLLKAGIHAKLGVGKSFYDSISKIGSI